MHYVYIIKSIEYLDQIYIGQTSHLAHRLDAHNAGKSFHTSKYKPWKISMYFAFEEAEKAIEFEKFLKSGAGNAFLKKRIF